MSDKPATEATAEPVSPEATGTYQCPKCPNNVHFTGIDANGFDPTQCDCGRYDEGDDDDEDGEEDKRPDCCTCLVELKQDFDVRVQGADGDVNYHEHDGGVGSEIGSHTEILCRCCGATVWKQPENGAE